MCVGMVHRKGSCEKNEVKVAACVVGASFSALLSSLSTTCACSRDACPICCPISIGMLYSEANYISISLTCRLFTQSAVLDPTRDERAVFAFVATRRGGTKAKRGTAAKESRAMCSLMRMYIVLDNWLGFDRIFMIGAF